MEWQVIESKGDRHDISLRITPEGVEANTLYSNLVADALMDVVDAIVAAGITGGEPQYDEQDSYCKARIRLTDGRQLQLVAHYVQIGKE